MYTTLNKIREHSPCVGGWTKLLANLGKTKGDDEPLAITTVLDSNGLDDALWCLRAVEGYDREKRLFAVDCARSVAHLNSDPREVATIDTAERYAYGLCSDEERAAAWDAAGDAAAARDAARDAAGVAAWAAARDAAWDAAGAAAGAAAWDAARAAAWAAARGAARDAAWDAAGAAAWAAARAAAWDAAREVQADLLRIVCVEIELRNH